MKNLEPEWNNRRISWRGINKIYSGTIVGTHDLGFLVRLDNGKHVVIDENSIIQ